MEDIIPGDDGVLEEENIIKEQRREGLVDPNWIQILQFRYAVLQKPNLGQQI